MAVFHSRIRNRVHLIITEHVECFAPCDGWNALSLNFQYGAEHFNLYLNRNMHPNDKANATRFCSLRQVMAAVEFCQLVVLV